MRKIVQTNLFKRDYKRLKKRRVSEEKFISTLQYLVSDTVLPKKYKSHKLVWEYLWYWECHIEPDWLLIYELIDNEIILRRTGSHSDLFR